MSTREPSDEAVLAARIQRAYPSLNPYQSASLARDLGKIERAQRRHAERCCNGADGGYVRRRFPSRDDDCSGRPMVIEHDPVTEQRTRERLGRNSQAWLAKLGEWILCSEGLSTEGLAPCEMRQACARTRIELEEDPRGGVLKVQFPGETEARSA